MPPELLLGQCWNVHAQGAQYKLHVPRGVCIVHALLQKGCLSYMELISKNCVTNVLAALSWAVAIADSPAIGAGVSANLKGLAVVWSR